jgi:Mg/Co/Ni transporter MgtE
MEDFNRQYVKEHFSRLTPEERREALESLPLEEREEVLQTLPPEERMAGLSPEQIRQYLDQLTAGRRAAPRKPRRKK